MGQQRKTLTPERSAHGDRVGALYVNPDGTFEVSTVTTSPPYDVTGQQPATGR